MLKGERTRLSIIETAIRLAAKHGFAETSFQMIADELDLSQSAVMYHFSSKNDLFGELVQTIVRHNHETVEELLDINDDAGRRLLKYCVGNVLWAQRYRSRDAQILILLYYMACHVKAFASLFGQMIRNGRARLMGHLLAGGREKLFRLKTSPEAAAEVLQDALFGAMLYAASSPGEPPGPAALEAKWRSVIAALTGWEESSPVPVVPSLK